MFDFKKHIKLSIALEFLVVDFGHTVRLGVGEIPTELVIVSADGTAKAFITIQSDSDGYFIGRKDLAVCDPMGNA